MLSLTSVNTIINSDLEKDLYHMGKGLVKQGPSCPLLNSDGFAQFTLPLRKRVLRSEQPVQLQLDNRSWEHTPTKGITKFCILSTTVWQGLRNCFSLIKPGLPFSKYHSDLAMLAWQAAILVFTMRRLQPSSPASMLITFKRTNMGNSPKLSLYYFCLFFHLYGKLFSQGKSYCKQLLNHCSFL